jgi:hypothetical protein
VTAGASRAPGGTLHSGMALPTPDPAAELGAKAPPAPARPHPIWPALITLLVVALIASAFALGAASSRATPPASVVTARPTPSLVTAVRDLARLETTEIHVEKVVDLTDTQSRLFGLVEGTDAILLVAVGRATVGVDLAKLGEGDVTLDPATHTARLRLPEPDLLGVALDEDATYVYRRSTSLLARRSERLEAQARREAVAAIEKAARTPDTLARARGQAERQLRALITQLGAERVEITWVPAAR